MNRFTLPPLPYSYDALEPHIDKETMEIHHSKHHSAYISGLNSNIANCSDLSTYRLPKILCILNKSAEDVQILKNFAGGHYNHSLFWLIMTNKSCKIPKGFENIIESSFGSVDEFIKTFKAKSLGVFGSGWVWLCYEDKKLVLLTTQNQDTPISEKRFPILAFDVWEHAYYLKYQNRRVEYIENFLKVIDWDRVYHFYKRYASQYIQVPIQDDGQLLVDTTE